MLAASRDKPPQCQILHARPEEIRRAREQSPANPEIRFHYRYQAALLAWEAAKLMTFNESDQTAFVLCQAGSWLKYRDPETADISTKPWLRCRTAIGAEADLRRWFPEVAADG